MSSSTTQRRHRRLRILVVTQYFWPENFQINQVVRGLRDLGHDVVVLTGKPNYPGGAIFSGYRVWSRTRDDFDGIPVYRVPLVPRGRGGGLRLAINYISFAISGSMLGPRLVGKAYDAIFVYQPSPVTVALPAIRLRRRTGAATVIWVQDLWPESVAAAGGIRAGFVMRALDRLVRYIYARCDKILVQSRAFFPSILAKGVSNDRIVYFPQSVAALFRPMATAETTAEASLMPPGFRIVFAGNVGHAQDFETVLEAADRLRRHGQIKWIVIGDGRRSAWLASEVTRRGLQDAVHLLGRHPEEAMPRFFAVADILLVTLRREPIFALTIPTKVQAYMACGKPILAALEGEGARIIEEAGAGRVCPSSDPEGLADAALRLFEASHQERLEMGQRGLAYSQAHFNRDRLIAELAGLLEREASRSDRRAVNV